MPNEMIDSGDMNLTTFACIMLLAIAMLLAVVLLSGEED